MAADDPKYTIVARGRLEMVIATCCVMAHADNPGPLGTIPVAAGFYRASILPGGELHVYAYGGSDTLGLTSRGEEDAGLIRRQILGME